MAGCLLLVLLAVPLAARDADLMHQLSSTPTLQHVVNECSVSTTKACPGLVSRVEVNPMTGISSRTLEWHAARLTGPGSETREGVPVLQMPEKAAGFMMDSPSSTIQVTEHSTGEETATDAVFFHSLSILDVELVGFDVQVNDQEFVVSDPRELNISQSGRQPVSGEESPQWRHTVTLPGASVLKLIPWSRFPCGPRRGGRPVLTWRLRYRYNTCDGHQHLYLAWPFSHQLDWSHKRCCRLRAPRTTIDAVGTSFVDAAVRVPQGQLVVWTSLNPGHNVVQIADPATTPNQCSALPGGFRSSYYGDWDYDYLGGAYEYKRAAAAIGLEHYMCEPHCPTGGMRASLEVHGLGCLMQWGWAHEGDGTSHIDSGHAAGVHHACLITPHRSIPCAAIRHRGYLPPYVLLPL